MEVLGREEMTIHALQETIQHIAGAMGLRQIIGLAEGFAMTA